MEQFKILSIDGGGIRGLFPATILSEIETHLSIKSGTKVNLHDYFYLIGGTSTGGILAIGLALGMSANDLMSLYFDRGKDIFSNKRNLLGRLCNPTYDSQTLQELLKAEFSKYSENGDTRLGHAKTRLCIPIFNAEHSVSQVLKTAHHQNLYTDFQIPAYQAALATSAAPTYFNPASFNYNTLSNDKKIVIRNNNIDGGVFCNNPALVGINEAVQLHDIPLDKIKLLSIGTGINKFQKNDNHNSWGLYFWIGKKNIFDLMIQSQSMHTENMISILNQGITKKDKTKFQYHRIQTEFRDKPSSIELDDTDKTKLRRLVSLGQEVFKEQGTQILDTFFSDKVSPYNPFYSL